MKRYIIWFIVFFGIASTVIGQPGKLYIQKEQYAGWESLNRNYKLSANGKWIAWSIGDNLLYSAIGSGKINKVSTGPNPIFSIDNSWLSYKLKNGSFDSVSLKTGKKKPNGNELNMVLDRKQVSQVKPKADTIKITGLKGIPYGKIIDYTTKVDINGNGSIFSFDLKDAEVEASLPLPKVETDIWHWKDAEIEYRIQNGIKIGRPRSVVHKWIYNVSTSCGFELKTAGSIAFIKSLGGNFLLIKDAGKYWPAFKEWEVDVYLLDTRTGQKKVLLEKVVFPKMFDEFKLIEFAPDESTIVYFKDRHWWSYDIGSEKRINLTKTIPATFWDPDYDKPGRVPPLGYLGWNKTGGEVFLYDEYNIYGVKTDGTTFRKLTNGEKEKITFRFANVNGGWDEDSPKIVDLSKPVMLRAFGKSTGYSGYYELNQGKLDRLIYENCFLSRRLTKADSTEVYAYTVERSDEPPSLWVMGKGYKKPVLITETNVQQKKYHWSKSEMVTYISKSGKALQGALFYPAGYEQGKKYPMVVSIYERLSQNVNRYIKPSVTAYSVFNFTQQGYFVLQPDIHYEVNDPGVSAAGCVIPAVEAVLKKDIVNRDMIGLMGHSWGAYGTTFIISQTNLFKAAVAGAPPTDLVSFSLGFRWQSGSTSQLFEGGQARFSGPFYEQQEAYIRNSSVYQSKNIHTPLLIAFGDKDGYVDWHQGIELYNAMRRQQKPCIMLHYEGKGHQNLPEDYAIKQMEYFDHYLKGIPAPEWMSWEESKL